MPEGVSLSGQLTVDYGYDFAGRPVSAGGIVTAAAYLPFGPLKTIQFANGTTQTLAYDERYLVTSNELTIDGLPPATGRIARYEYLDDAAGNITDIKDKLDPTYDRHFGYDDLNRLTSAATGESLWVTGTYEWDAMGNILRANLSEVVDGGPENLSARNPKKFKPTDKPKKKKQASQTSLQPLAREMIFFYRESTPVIESVALNGLSRTVGHDPAGNEISYVVNRTYSPRNLLAEVRDEGEPGSPVHTLAYAYDGRGLRVVRAESPSDGPGTTARRFFVYGPELQLLAATRDDGPNVWGGNPPTTFGNNVDYEIVWFGGRPVAQVVPGGSPLYTFTDHLGTPILQTDQARVTRWRVEYEPFGNVYEVREGTRTDQPLRFPGQEMAMTWEGPEESYNMYRWYRAGWGRYTQADPLGKAGDPNPFSYAGANPLRNSDSTGLRCCRPKSITARRWPRVRANRVVIAHEVCATVDDSSKCDMMQRIVQWRWQVGSESGGAAMWEESLATGMPERYITRPNRSTICLRDPGVGLATSPSEAPIVYRGRVYATVYDPQDPSDRLTGAWTVEIDCQIGEPCYFFSMGI